MSEGFTMGEWIFAWREEDSHGAVLELRQAGHAYAIAVSPRYGTKDDWLRVGPLLSAAPEMLEALQYILDDVEPTEFALSYVAREKAEAALSKARGVPNGS